MSISVFFGVFGGEKQSQFVRIVYCVMRIALKEFEKTKPILVSPQIYSGG